MITRRLYSLVIQALKRQAAVALLGPRQVGKTTLALEVARCFDAVYVDLERPSHRRQLDEPDLFLQHNENKLVVLDEIHHQPEVFKILRSQIDVRRQQGRRTGHFLILGSASVDLLRQSGESLAGRIEYITMNPFDISELVQQSSPQLDTIQKTINTLWVRGGLPDSYLASQDQDSFIFRQNFIHTYLVRDVKEFGVPIPAPVLEKLWIMLAHQQGCIVNVSQLAAGLSLSAPTITRYIDVLEQLFLVRRLPPFTRNIKKRLVKRPKIYIRDSGLVHSLLNLQNYNAVVSHPVVGGSWEGFVIENILSRLQQYALRASFYRTSAGAEIDLMLEGLGDQLWAIEIKRSKLPERGFYEALKELKPDQVFLICADAHDHPMKHNVRCMGLYQFLQHLDQYAQNLK